MSLNAFIWIFYADSMGYGGIYIVIGNEIETDYFYYNALNYFSRLKKSMDKFLHLKWRHNADVESNGNAEAGTRTWTVGERDRLKEGMLQFSQWIAICWVKL